MEKNDQNSEYQVLLKRLEDPNVNKWEKLKIRSKLGIYLKLQEEDFDRTDNDRYSTFFYEYISDQIGRLKKEDASFKFENLPVNIRFIFCLWGFSSLFDSGAFRDYSDNSLDEYEKRNGYSLRSDKTDILNGLVALGLADDKQLLKSIWSKAEVISNEEIEELQKKFWSIGYKTEYENRLKNLIKRNKKELLELQNR